MQLIGISVLVFSLTVMLLVLLRVPAIKVGWVDIPGGRKQHEGRVPLVGGLAMFVALMLASLVGLFSWSAYYNGFLIGALVLLVSGLFDDRFDISPLTKLIAQGLAAWCLIGTGEFTGGLGDFLGSGTVPLGWIGMPVAVFAVVGLINAVNFFDGLDGLAAGMGLLTLIALTLVASVTNQIQILPMLIACLAAVAGFWVFNMRFHERQPAFVFMGNAGSMVLGHTGLVLAPVDPDRRCGVAAGLCALVSSLAADRVGQPDCSPHPGAQEPIPGRARPSASPPAGCRAGTCRNSLVIVAGASHPDRCGLCLLACRGFRSPDVQRIHRPLSGPSRGSDA